MSPGECYAQAIADTLPKLPADVDVADVVDAVDERADVLWEGDPQQGVPDDPGAGREKLTCRSCGRIWVRKVKRGRKPATCPDC